MDIPIAYCTAIFAILAARDSGALFQPNDNGWFGRWQLLADWIGCSWLTAWMNLKWVELAPSDPFMGNPDGFFLWMTLAVVWGPLGLFVTMVMGWVVAMVAFCEALKALLA